MRITHSSAAERTVAAAAKHTGAPLLELAALLVASLVSLAGVWLVYSAKKTEIDAASPPSARLALDLNGVDRAEQLLPALEPVIADPAERRFVAD